MGLLNDLEMQPERQIPAPLPTAIQQPLDDCRPFVPTANWRCPATTAMSETSLPDAAPSGCKSLCSAAANAGAWPRAWGIALLGDDTRYQRFSKNPRPRARPGRLGTESRPGRPMGGLRQECHWQVAAAYAVAGTAAVVEHGTGTGRVMDRKRTGRGELKVVRDADTGAVGGASGGD